VAPAAGNNPGTLGEKLSRRQATMAQFLRIPAKELIHSLALICLEPDSESCLRRGVRNQDRVSGSGLQKL